MPRKLKSSALWQKVSRFLKFPIFMARMRKSINIPRLISLKKSRKIKKFMLLKHYKYRYVQEYQFSPSNSPFLQYYYREPMKKRRYKDLYSIFLVGKCLGSMTKAKKEYSSYPLELKVLPSNENTVARELSGISELSGEDDDDEYSIDERAEKFIERFYEEMRMQRQKLLMQFNPVMIDVDS